jgi:putative FmdB family regulatory protein
MPNYEYRCLDCKKRFEIFISYQEYETIKVSCKLCGSTNVQRRIGRIRISRSNPDRLQNLADPSHLDSIDHDPQALGSMMRQMRSELGEEMPAEFDEVVDRLDHGQSPEQIDNELPDISDGMTGNDESAPDLDF